MPIRRFSDPLPPRRKFVLAVAREADTPDGRLGREQKVLPIGGEVAHAAYIVGTSAAGGAIGNWLYGTFVARKEKKQRKKGLVDLYPGIGRDGLHGVLEETSVEEQGFCYVRRKKTTKTIKCVNVNKR